MRLKNADVGYGMHSAGTHRCVRPMKKVCVPILLAPALSHAVQRNGAYSVFGRQTVEAVASIEGEVPAAKRLVLQRVWTWHKTVYHWRDFRRLFCVI